MICYFLVRPFAKSGVLQVFAYQTTNSFPASSPFILISLSLIFLPSYFLLNHRKDEEQRIRKLGGSVVHWGRWRVEGILAVSR